MNTLQIKRALERDTFTKKIFGGVFAADELPKIMNTFPCGFVANTDPSTEPGTHWVAFYFPSREKGELAASLADKRVPYVTIGFLNLNVFFPGPSISTEIFFISNLFNVLQQMNVCTLLLRYIYYMSFSRENVSS